MSMGSTRLGRRVRLQSMIWRSSTKIVRFGLALSLSLWIAGAGCVFGCESMFTAAQEPQGATEAQFTGRNVSTVVSQDVCASTKSHDCCVKNKKAHGTRTETPQRIGFASQQGLPRETMRCPLAVNGVAVVTKTSGKQIVAPVALSTASLPTENTLEQKAALSPPRRLPNRGHTYLRCCVFLI
jgi:hypothetical protein